MPLEFTDVIRTESQFRAVMGEPSNLVTAKTLAELDKHCKAFISKSPFVLISSSGKQGDMDISPKGDPEGFVKVLDDSTLAIPDRLGNRRADTFVNLLENPKLGLIFLVPGKKETLRISGRAIIVRDLSLRNSMTVKGKSPDFAIVVTIKEAFFHCAKCIVRSKLWQHDAWPTVNSLPLLAETMVDAGNLDMTVEEVQAIVEKDETNRLY